MQRFVQVVSTVMPRAQGLGAHALCSSAAVRGHLHAHAMQGEIPAFAPPTLDQFPALAACFVGASTSKFHDAATMDAQSRRLAWWRCSSCGHQHRCVVRSFVASRGRCPSCGSKPSRSRSPPLEAPLKRCIATSAESPSAMREGQIKSHITEVPTFSTPQWRKILQPMLAKSFDKVGAKIRWELEEVVASPKIDGVRCLVVCDAPPNSSLEVVAQGLYFVTRSGILLDSCNHLRPQLAPVFQAHPGLVLDSEVYASCLTRRPTPEDAPIKSFDELVGVVRRGREFAPESIIAKQQALELYVFDVTGAHPSVVSAPFTQRHKFLSSILPQSPSLRLVPAVRISGEGEAHRVAWEFITKGYEGAMIRRASLCRYAHGARSPNLLKLKSFEDSEFVVVGVVEGKGKWKGMLGAFVCLTADGAEFQVSPQADDARRRAMWLRHKTFNGCALTVQYQGLLPSGVPRFPVGKAIRGMSIDDQRDWI